MPLFAAAAVVIGLFTIVWLLATADPRLLARALRGIAIGVLVLLGLLLLLRGLAVLDLPLGGLIIYLVHHWSARGFPGVAGVKQFVAGRAQPPSGSTIETGMLRMTLDQATGALHGEVLDGQFTGTPLDRLTLAQLRIVLGECAAADAQSQRLLETYLDRTHPDWRTPSPGVAMSREEALQVLGLAASADLAQIRAAHRRLMSKLHPDHGGTDYLASKINAARDVLMGAEVR